MKLFFKSWPIIIIFLAVLIFSRPFLFQGKLPIPSDTIIGLYHPFRDLYKDNYPNGIPFKNFLITDPVREQYPWKKFSVDILKDSKIPSWNPYTFSGTPHLANHQSAPFYPLNIIFFFLPFALAWSLFILIQPLLAALFSYWYLRNLNILKPAALLGALAFAFSGFFVAWLEWGTILHAALWLPLMLLAVDKIFLQQMKNKKLFLWYGLFTFSLVASFFAGHLQTFFYIFLLLVAHLIVRFIQSEKKKQVFLPFFLCFLVFLLFTAIQSVPMVHFILTSARSLDQSDFQKPGWFIPWQHLLQFIVPDFFGNPSTLNYWGEWNYGEFIGYVGILPTTLALFATFIRRDKKVFFYGAILFLSLLFALPTFAAKIPFLLSIPMLSTAQPTRLLFLTDFSLAMLSALGFDFFLKKEGKKIFYPLVFMGVLFLSLWVLVFSAGQLNSTISPEHLLVAKNNLILPSILFAVSILLLSLFRAWPTKKKSILIAFLIGIAVFDLLRFTEKFNPFVKHEYLFPNTKAIAFLQDKTKEGELFRIATTDDRILPPNFSMEYGLSTIEGYDPLYLQRYAELIAASERGKPNINPPFGFNRIIAPHNMNSKIVDLLNVKYVLSLTDLLPSKFIKVFQEGETRIYENTNVIPRAFFVDDLRFVKDKKETIKTIFQSDIKLVDVAVLEEDQKSLFAKVSGIKGPSQKLSFSKGSAKVISYKPNTIVIETKNTEDGFLVISDNYYPGWKASIDGDQTTILRTDYNMRGIFVSKGSHIVTMNY